MWGRLEGQSYLTPHGPPLSHKRHRQDRSDSGVSAAVWGGGGRSIIRNPPNKAPLSPKRPRQDRRESGVSATVLGGVGSPLIHGPATGRPHHHNGLGSTRGTRVYPPLCGEDLDVQTSMVPRRGVSISLTAQAAPEGLGCFRRCVGRGWKVNHSRPPHRASLSPQRPR